MTIYAATLSWGDDRFNRVYTDTDRARLKYIAGRLAKIYRVQMWHIFTLRND